MSRNAELDRRIGANLRRQRESCGLSQAQVGDCLGLDRVSMCLIEGGRQSLTAAQLVLLLQFFKGIPAEWIIGDVLVEV